MMYIRPCALMYILTSACSAINDGLSSPRRSCQKVTSLLQSGFSVSQVDIHDRFEIGASPSGALFGSHACTQRRLARSDTKVIRRRTRLSCNQQHWYKLTMQRSSLVKLLRDLHKQSCALFRTRRKVLPARSPKRNLHRFGSDSDLPLQVQTGRTRRRTVRRHVKDNKGLEVAPTKSKNHMHAFCSSCMTANRRVC